MAAMTGGAAAETYHAPDPGAVALDGAAVALRSTVLKSLSGLEYRPVASLPHRWPVVRPFVTRTVHRLLAEGLVETMPIPSAMGDVPGYRATAAGRRELHRLIGRDPG